MALAEIAEYHKDHTERVQHIQALNKALDAAKKGLYQISRDGGYAGASYIASQTLDEMGKVGL